MNGKNENPSVSTSIYWLIQDSKIEPVDIFKFLEFFWPSFIEKGNYVFLKEKFSEEEYCRLIEGNDNPEYWINLCTVNDFFSELPNSKEISVELVKKLFEIWEVKLKKEFPEINFKIECVLNEEDEDCGITFYRSDNDNSSLKFSELVSPNIKENSIKQSSTGPRVGMPIIRKPRPDELPGT